MRLLLFYLVLVAAQGFLSALLSPLPAPDLFLLGMLTLLWRLPPWQLVLVGYGAGLIQDLAGAGGVLGLHAIGLAAAALTASLLRAQLSHSGSFERILIVLAAVTGKWLTLVTMLFWLQGSFDLGNALSVAALEAALTLLAATLLIPWGDALLERTSALRKELL